MQQWNKGAMITIVLPTRNEATIIRANLERLLAFLRTTSLVSFRALRPGSGHAPREISQDWKVIVADNASTDATRAIVREIAAHEPRVELLELPEPGKGGAVLAAWRAAAASFQPQAASNDNFVFMDADLATDLRHLPELVAAIRNGADIAIGSRNLPGSRSERGIGRRAISWCYRILLHLLFNLRVSDPPCGFKAVNERVVREIVPLVRDRQWFFDTELLIRSQRAGMRITEIPVTWHEPRRGGSLRKVLRIVNSDLRAMWQLERDLHSTISPPL